jgi:hypothetical protein
VIELIIDIMLEKKLPKQTILENETINRDDLAKKEL